MLGYVCPNIVVLKVLHELCGTPLYVDAYISIRRNWEDITSFATISENDGLDELTFVYLSNSPNVDKFTITKGVPICQVISLDLEW
jgi:hypothetical protein